MTENTSALDRVATVEPVVNLLAAMAAVMTPLGWLEP